MFVSLLGQAICKFDPLSVLAPKGIAFKPFVSYGLRMLLAGFPGYSSKAYSLTRRYRYALAADIQTIPGLSTAPGYLNVDIDPLTGEIDGLF